ncbi:YNFM family putative membrane transporter [Aneurinibacillus soli]|uniref:Inner membrane transport protein YnfM n=1 Tax=Aneurinibacillus soli TaxID=1500254 RepID=A0A0U4ND54_9BACL|nr:MFS transporter [Aneurinibacillus soli]PYE60964.1 YNFM family putative membrane transporter [Aneurinibacillus soli]BAU26868.1 Inner membrane transport protein YnfM [Aneurinibacillus soli]
MIQAGTRPFWRATAALTIASFVTFANIYFTQPLLPIFTEEFNLSPLLSSLSVSVTILALALSLLFYGPLSDAIGRKNIMFGTMLGVALIALLTAFVPNFSTLLILRMIEGFFLAGLPAIAIAYISEEFDSKALTTAVGIYISGNTIGGLSGRMVSGFVTDFAGWHWAFIVMSALSFLCVISFAWLLPRSTHFQSKPLDWKVAFRDFRRHLDNRSLRFAYAIGGFHFFVFIGIYNYITYVLNSAPFNLPTSIVSLLFLTYLAGTFSSTLSGKVAKIMPQSVCIAIGIVLMGAGIAATLVQNLWIIGVGLLLISFGFFFAHSAASSWVSTHATFAKASASSLYLLSYYLGGSIGSFYLGLFYKFFGWNGVVLGSLMILVLTGWCAWKMYGIERAESSKAGVMSKVFLTH